MAVRQVSGARVLARRTLACPLGGGRGVRAEGKATGKAPPQAGASGCCGAAAPTATRDARDRPTPSSGSGGLGETAPDAGTPAREVGLLRLLGRWQLFLRANLGVFI